MANLSITTECNRRCRYCFAEPMASRPSLRREHFGRLLDLLARSGISQVRLLGGEPTLHADFPLLVQEAVDRGFTLVVFSNGMMPDSSLQALAGLPPERCVVLLNVRCPADDTAEDRQRFCRTCETLGPRASVGVNIYRPGLPLSDLFELFDRWPLRRSIRLGLAHPRAGADNDFLQPKFYHLVGQELLGLARQSRQQGVELTFDCGFVPCMFSAEFLEVTGLAASDLGQRCGPIPDILPDLSAIYCHALGELERFPISGIETTAELIRLHATRYRDVRRLGVYRECATCRLKQGGQCHGGCLAAALRRLHRQGTGEGPPPRRVREPIAASDVRSARGGQQRWMLPYIDQPREFWQELAAKYPARIQGVYFPLPHAGCGSGRPPQPSQHLATFLEQEAVGKQVLINPIVLPRPVGEIGPQIVDQVAQLAEEHHVTGATVGDLRLAEMIRRRLPKLELTASVLLDIHQPHQAQWLEGLFEVLVPASRILRSRQRLQALRSAFSGRLRLLVNEGCLPGCPYRQQHFYEMASSARHPESLCQDLLTRQSWLRLIGAWVLPQHLFWFDELADEYKLAGRVTLRQPDDYRRVCDAYLYRTALWPDEIGGGPAAVLDRIMVSDALFAATLACDLRCHECDLCRRFARTCGLDRSRAIAAQSAATDTSGELERPGDA